MNVFIEPDGFLIALTYGQDSEWVRNVVAAGGCQLETRRVLYQLSAPTIVHDPTRRPFPLLVRMIHWCERFHAAFNFSHPWCCVLIISECGHTAPYLKKEEGSQWNGRMGSTVSKTNLLWLCE